MPAQDLNPPAVQLSPDGAAIRRSISTPEAFTEVFDRHFTVVHRYVARRAGRDCADDLASQTFLVAFERRDGYRDGLGSARPWLLGIATNLLREQHRGERRTQVTIAQLTSEAVVSGNGFAPGSAHGHPLGTADEDDDLAQALSGLDPAQRDALLLHAWGELSYAEIAESLEIPIGTVRSRISRACAALRSQLRPRAAAPAGTTLQEERP